MSKTTILRTLNVNIALFYNRKMGLTVDDNTGVFVWQREIDTDLVLHLIR